MKTARGLKAVAMAVVLGLLASSSMTACTARKGKAQTAGEKVDRALGLN